MSRDEAIRKFQRIIGTGVDGDPGRLTWRQFGDFILAAAAGNETIWDELVEFVQKYAPPAEELVYAGPLAISENAVNLILESEGLDQPGKWPGGASGITLGRGYDLGYSTIEQFVRDWEPYLHPDEILRLSHAVGKKGSIARAIAPQFRDIRISAESADKIFQKVTLPKYGGWTLEAFPGVELLPADARGALVSLVFNRGKSMTYPCGDQRKEMREIRSLVNAHARGSMPIGMCLGAIAQSIREMKRLWIGKGLDGLILRREKEARMMEEAA